MMRWTAALRAALCASVLTFTAGLAAADDSEQLLTIDHYVTTRSGVPALNGQPTQIYVRERALAGPAMRGAKMTDRVVLFVHGAGTPAAVAFDVPYSDYSWMAFLARAGFDTFAMDQTGYGRSARPSVMNDPCNLPDAQRPAYVKTPCTPNYAFVMTNSATDWAEVGAVVDHIRALRGVDKVALVAWSQGGHRAAGYAAQNPDKVSKLVLLAPVYNRAATATPPAQLPAPGVAFNMQSRDDLVNLWYRQTGCSDQWDQPTLQSVWSEMLASDPVGAAWGPGGRRAPNYTTWGWGPAMAAQLKIPTLMVSGVHDVQVAPDRVRELYADLAAEQKVFIDLGCSSHNAMWEKNHLLLFKASLDWLANGTVNGTKSGMLKMGY